MNDKDLADALWVRALVGFFFGVGALLTLYFVSCDKGCRLSDKTVDRGTELDNVEWFAEDTLHTHLLVSHAGVIRKHRRHDDNFCANAAFSQFTNKFQPTQLRHLLIDNDHVVGVRLALNDL